MGGGLCGPCCLYGSAQGELGHQQDGFDATATEALVQAAAEEAAQLYDSDGKEAFGDITGQDPDRVEYPTFVLNSTTGEIVAYGGHPQMVGSILSDIFAADRPYDEVVEDMRGGNGTWITSLLTNKDITRQADDAGIHDVQRRVCVRRRLPHTRL